MSLEFEEAFKKNKGFMYKAARSVGCNHAKAQDAVARALEKLIGMKDTIMYADERKVRGLFCLEARRSGIVLHNKEVLDAGLADLTMPNPMSAPVGSMDRAIWVHQTLAKLDEQDRFIAWKYWALELSLQDLCDELKLRGVEWSRQNLHKHLRKLKGKLKALFLNI